MYSIGFKCGEYGGKNTNSISFSFANSMVAFAPCDLKLSSIMTTFRFEFLDLIFPRKSQTDSVFEFSLNTDFRQPFISHN